MFFRLLLAFTLIPLAELYLLIRIGAVIGAFSTLLLVIVTGLTGASLARAEGIRVVREIQQTMARGEIPTRELLGGLMVLVGGLMLLTPGLITDLLGLTMIIPLTRRCYVLLVEEAIRRRIAAGRWTVYIDPRGGPFRGF